ncbi:EcsC family protein [Xanthomonas arboricola]|uniref:EcsC family protein n=1 Tax=Xanthomonas arboricola TaxID=56448 RepID=UPI000C859F48|nr:EcsC family protein [Xanthomonas arboricola]
MDVAAQRDLATAHALLENPGVAARLANAMGAPIESLITRRLPKLVTRSIDGVTRRALQVAMKSALLSLRSTTDLQQPASTVRHTMAVAVAGGAGGFFGLPGLLVELPVTTTVMLRSIADIARSEGESLQDPDTALACLEVLAHGGRSVSDDGAESGYFAVRAAMAQQLSAAAHYVTAHGFASKGAPVLVSLVSRVAAKFSVNVGEKLAVQAVPLVGAVSGATLNTVFMRHFQAMARGHFIMRRLERRYGEDAVRRAYDALPAAR